MKTFFILFSIALVPWSILGTVIYLGIGICRATSVAMEIITVIFTIFLAVMLFVWISYKVVSKGKITESSKISSDDQSRIDLLNNIREASEILQGKTPVSARKFAWKFVFGMVLAFGVLHGIADHYIMKRIDSTTDPDQMVQYIRYIKSAGTVAAQEVERINDFQQRKKVTKEIWRGALLMIFSFSTLICYTFGLLGFLFKKHPAEVAKSISDVVS